MPEHPKLGGKAGALLGFAAAPSPSAKRGSLALRDFRGLFRAVEEKKTVEEKKAGKRKKKEKHDLRPAHRT
jgi:hypothetical protein